MSPRVSETIRGGRTGVLGDYHSPRQRYLSNRQNQTIDSIRRVGVSTGLVRGKLPVGHDRSIKSRVHPKYKIKYRVGNWPGYDRALVQRGDVTVWLTPDAITEWETTGFGKRGGQLLHLGVDGAGATSSTP